MIQACVFCLSQDRDLLKIDESLYFSVYPSFKEKNYEYINYLKAENLLKLCWECQGRVTNFKKFLDTAERSLNTLKMVMVLPSGDLPKSESRLHITTAYCINIEGAVPLLLPPKVEKIIDDADHSAVEPVQQEQKDNDVSVTAVKLELNLDELDDNDIGNDDGDGKESDTQASVPGGSFSINNLSKDDNINKDNDTTSNKHIEDDHSLPAVWVAPLPLIIPISQCKKVSNHQTSLPGKESNKKIISNQSSLTCKDSIKKIKLSDNNVRKNDNINNDNDTTFNKHIEDDHRSPEVRDEPLPLIIPKSQYKRVSKQSRPPGIECNIKITTSSLLGQESIKKIKLSDNDNDVSVSAAKLEDSDINNDTTSNNHTEDDPRPPAASTSSLPPDSTKTPCIKIVDSGKSAKKRMPRPKPLKSLKFDVVWASTEQAMRWHREELRRAREASLSFVHECDACERLFAEEEELNRHVADAHSEEAGKYTCDVCLYRFPDHTKLKQHMEAHYINYKCKTCSFESRILAEMQKHVSDTHPNTKCLKCRNEFASRAELDLHYSLCETYKCSYCKAKFSFRDVYMEHTQKHLADPDGIYCEVCDVFCSPSWYRQHLRTTLKHVSRDSFKHECEICHNKYPTARKLAQHMVGTHKRPGPHPCDLCQKSFFKKCYLLSHRATVHKTGPGKVRKYVKDKMCETCGKGFQTAVALSSHRNRHTGERPWRCPDCPAAFTSSAILGLHRVKIHDKAVNRVGQEERPNKFCCDVCGKQFHFPSELKNHNDFFHLKKATKYHCTICDKYFRRASTLRVHNRTHMRLPCEPCGKWFKDPEALDKHLKKHSLPSWKGPYKCRSCDVTYSARNNMYEHYKLKHLHLKKDDRVTIKNLYKLDKEVEVIWMDKK